MLDPAFDISSVVDGLFPMHVMILVFMFAMLGVAWNIMGGYAGMFSFGQAAFFGIGAYTSSYLLMTFQVNPWLGTGCRGDHGGLGRGGHRISLLQPEGALFRHCQHRLCGDRRVPISITGRWSDAAEGISLPMLDESLCNFMFHTSKLPYYYIILAFLLLAIGVCYFVATSKMGYYFRAIKESHDVAEVLGVNVVRYRLIAIMISAFLSAMAGTFYAQYILYIDPESVMLLAISIQIVLISMLGGPARSWVR